MLYSVSNVARHLKVSIADVFRYARKCGIVMRPRPDGRGYEPLTGPQAEAILREYRMAQGRRRLRKASRLHRP